MSPSPDPKAMRARDTYHVTVDLTLVVMAAGLGSRFGGTKQTGNGHREAGTAALDVFSEWKAIYVDYSGRLQKAQMED